MVEAAILLRHENNVVENLHGLIDIERRGNGFICVNGYGAGRDAFAGAGPSGKVGSLGGERE